MSRRPFRHVSMIVWTVLSAAVAARGATNLFSLNGGDYATPGNWSLGTIPGNGNNDQPWIGSAATRAATYSTATDYTTTGRFVVGISGGGNGTLTLNGSAGTLTFGGDNYSNANYIGVDGGTGTVNVNAGALTFTSGAAIRIGANGAGANGTLNIGGGTVNVSSDIYVARAAASANVTGALNITAGALNIGSRTIFLSSGGNGVVNDPAGGTGGTASLLVSGGTLTALKIFAGAATGSPVATVGVSGTGVINTTEYIIGFAGSTATGTQTGGTVNITGGGTFFVGAFSAGTYNLTGGTVSIPTGELRIGHQPGGVGRFTLGGTGVLITPKISRNTGAGTFNFDGGTLKPAGSSTTFMTGLTAATVQSGGANIDTSGFDITIGQALLAGSPSGGLTKSGNGTLTLSGANTYTGTTAVQTGILEISGSGTTSASSTITIDSGATLRLSRHDTWGAHITATSSPIVVNAGGTLASNNTFNTLVNPTLAGGTLLLNGGALAAFPAFAIKGTLTVSGTSASNINVGSGSNNAINIGTNVGGGVTTFDVGDVTLSAATDLTINAPLKNNMNVAGTAEVASGLLKTGAGTMLLAVANTHSGTTTVTGGTLVLGHVNALTRSTLDTGTAGSQNVTFTVAGSNTYQINGLAGSDALNIGANSLSLAELGATTSYSGVLSGSGNLTKRGGGTQTLSGANSFSGSVAVQQGGTLSVPSVAASGNQPLGTGTGDINLANSSTLAITGAGTYNLPSTRGLSLSGAGGVLNVSAGTVNMSGGISGDTNSAHFTKAGAGTFNYSGSASWSGNFDLIGGTFNLTGGTIAGVGVTSLNNSGTTLRISAAGSMKTASLDIAAGTTVDLEAGTLRVGGGGLGVGDRSITNDGDFTWGNGTLAVYTTGSGEAGLTDRTALAGAASGPVVKEGNYLSVQGDVATSAGSTLDLGSTYLSNGLRYNQLNISGTLTLNGGTLNIGLNPYFLRPT